MTLNSARRLLLSLGVIVIAAGALTGCGGGDSKPRGDTDPANLVPASASAFLTITVRPEGKEKASAQRLTQALLGTASPGQAALDLLATQADALAGLSFADDVDPWLGDRVAIAVTPSESGDNDLLLVAASRDDEKARASIEKSRKLPDGGTFRNVSYSRSADGKAAAAVVGGAMLLGNERSLQQAITSIADDSVLSGAASYRSATGELPAAGIATVYVDFGAVAETIGGLLGGGATAELLAPVIGSQGDAIAARVIAEPGKLRIEAVATGTGDGIAAVQAEGGASDAITTLPGDSWLALGISDVGKSLNVLLDAVSSAGGIQAIGLNVLLGQIESSLGLSLRDDVLAWMGAGGLFVRSTASGKVGGALVVRSKDPAATRRAMRKLRGSLPGGITTRPLGAAGADESVTLSLGDLKLQLASKGSRFVIAIGPGALAAALDPKSELQDTAGFKDAAQRLGDDLRPGLYVDLAQVANLIDRSSDGKQGATLLAGLLRRMSQVAAGGKQDGDISRLRIVAGVPTS